MELKPLPDVAGQQNTANLKLKPLAWVGMSHVEMPIRLGEKVLPAQVTAQVNLKPETSRGIHMSRLYQIMTENFLANEISWSLLKQIAFKFSQSQQGLSDQARVQVKLEWPLPRTALKSGLQGWRLYPVEMEVNSSEMGESAVLTTEILYSSTCPASTALSREVWKESFQNQSQDVVSWMDSLEGMPAAPHAQRSKARVRIESAVEKALSPKELIENLEKVLGTPVQTAVKRVDEQEFARLNGQNPMFCEDAARRVQTWLDSQEGIRAYSGHFEHQESLHSHNAVAEIEKKS